MKNVNSVPRRMMRGESHRRLALYDDLEKALKTGPVLLEAGVDFSISEDRRLVRARVTQAMRTRNIRVATRNADEGLYFTIIGDQ